MGIGNSKSIAVLGDSITNGYYDEKGLGWISRLSAHLNEDKPNGYFFRNYAASGDCIYDIKYKLFPSIEKWPDILFIMVGVNDTQMYDNQNAPMALSREIRRELWYDLFRFAKKLVPQVYVFGLLPVDEAKVPARSNEWGSPQFYRNDLIKEYHLNIQEWCKEFDVPFIDLFDKFMKAVHVDLLADDVHPNSKGHELLAQLAYEALKNKI